MAKQINFEFNSVGGKQLSSELKGLTSQIRVLESVAKKGFALFLGRQLTQSVLDFQKSLFDLSRTSKYVGQSFQSLEKSIEDINKATNLSRVESASFLKQLQENQRGLRLTAQESTKLAKALSSEFGPSLKDVGDAMQKLTQVQNKEMFLLKNLEKGMDPKRAQAYALSLYSSGKATEEQALAIIRTSEAMNKNGKQLTDQEKSLIAFRESVQSLNQVWQDLRITIGVPVTQTLTKMINMLTNFGKKIRDTAKDSHALQAVFKMLPVAAAGAAGVSAVGGGLKLAGGLLSPFMSMAKMAGGLFGRGGGAVGAAGGKMSPGSFLGVAPKFGAIPVYVVNPGGQQLSNIGTAIAKSGAVGPAAASSGLLKKLLGGTGKLFGGIAGGGLLGGAAMLGGDYLGGALEKRGMGRAGAGARAAGNVAGMAGMGATIGSVIPGIGTAAGAAVGGIVGLITSIDQLKTAFPELAALIAPFEGTLTKLKAAFDPVIEAAKSLATTAFDQLKGIMSTLWESAKAMAPAMEQLAVSIGTLLANSIEAVLKVAEPIVEVLGTGLKAAIELLTPMLEILIMGLSKLASAIADVAKKVGQWTSNLLNKGKEFLLGEDKNDKGGGIGFIDNAKRWWSEKISGKTYETEGEKQARAVREDLEKRSREALKKSPIGQGADKSLAMVRETYSQENVLAAVKKTRGEQEKLTAETKKTTEESEKHGDSVKGIVPNYLQAFVYAKQLSETINHMVEAHIKLANIQSKYQDNLSGSFDHLNQSLGLIQLQKKAYEDVLSIFDQVSSGTLDRAQLEEKVSQIIRGQVSDEKEAKGLITEILANSQNRLDLEAAIGETVEKEMHVRREMDKQLQLRTDLAGQEVGLYEAQLNLTKSLYLGLGPTLEAQLNTVAAIEKQIDALDQQLSYWKAIRAQQPGNLEAQQKLMQLQTAKVGLVQKELDITKNLREGYMNAMTAFTNVEGFFSKMVLKQDYGIDILQQMGAAMGLRAGGRGAGGTSPLAQFKAGGQLQLAGGPFGWQAEFDKRMQGYGGPMMVPRGIMNVAEAQNQPGVAEIMRAQTLSGAGGAAAVGGQHPTLQGGAKSLEEVFPGQRGGVDIGNNDPVVRELVRIRELLEGKSPAAAAAAQNAPQDTPAAKTQAETQKKQLDEQKKQSANTEALKQQGYTEYQRGEEMRKMQENAISQNENRMGDWRKYFMATSDIMAKDSTAGAGFGRRYAGGGIVPGSGAGDKVPALLEPGEFVMNRVSTSQNLGSLFSMNAKKYREGGIVPPLSISGGSGYSPSIGINIRGDSVGSIVKAVQKELTSVLTKMMCPPGTTGRTFDLQKSG